MDTFFSFLFLLFVLFVLKIYFIQTSNNEGFQNKKLKKKRDKDKKKHDNHNSHNNQNLEKDNEDENENTNNNNTNNNNTNNNNTNNNNTNNNNTNNNNTNNNNTNNNTNTDSAIGGSGTSDTNNISNTGSINMVENMETPDVFEKVDKVSKDFEDLHKVYVRNTKVSFGKDDIKGPIPRIKTVSKPKIKISGGGKIFKPLISAITKPFTKIAEGFVKTVNIIIDVCNLIIDVINKAIYYAKCGFFLLINFFTIPCVFWYALNLACTVLYLPFAFIFWLIGINDLVEDYIWGPIYVADELVHDFSGFHFAHFPDNIMKGCYSCSGNIQVFGISGFSYIGDMFKDMFNVFK